MKKVLPLIALVAGFALLFAGIGFADVPAPPANQTLGFPDTEFNDLEEADCRGCHGVVADDHHLLYGSAMPIGECSGANGTCTGAGAEDCVADVDCPGGETCTPAAALDPCYSDAECAQTHNACNIQGQDCPVGTCSVTTGTSCEIDADCPAGETCDVGDCPNSWTGQYCSQPFCFGSTAAPNNPNAGVYGCLSCHDEDNTGGVINFVVYRDCTGCHLVGLNQGSVHHIDEGRTGAKAGDCTKCHGDIVDDPVGCKETVCTTGLETCLLDEDCATPGDTCDEISSADACADGHDIPDYDPSLVTPAPSDHALICSGAWGGSGTSCSDDTDCTIAGETCQASGPAIPGACNYCHDAGTDTATGTIVHDNHDTHHHAGVYKNRFGGSDDDAICAWCHKAGNPHNPGGEDPDQIRWCESCHGPESLHNIQADSPNAANIGTLVVGGEDYGYGHTGKDDPGSDSDCWGCHGFGVAADAVVELGSGVPTISSAAPTSMTAGADTAVAITGAAFSNGAVTVTLTDAVGAVISLDAANVTDGALTVTVNVAAGAYSLQVVKDGAASNVVGISVMPAVVVTDIDCSKCLGVMTISGANFAEMPEGAADINVTEGGVELDIISWTDVEIKAAGARCGGDVTVNSVYGSSE